MKEDFEKEKLVLMKNFEEIKGDLQKMRKENEELNEKIVLQNVKIDEGNKKMEELRKNWEKDENCLKN